ncbi:hypothetical protein CQ12_38155 [Bradyrhizobium jicamae]|uniref:Uncharacterized protein n=1 Tax=Bradyrhizobium jicamae TaxID=280332 RepID=A0A0R3KGV7_9BRAD|nr:hypothetical protein CQ12_38155 [Bradyrhizobium jicamae]GEC56803.1 hypothetical protein BEL01nite_58460 [Bradyrhizobium elkanii]
MHVEDMKDRHFDNDNEKLSFTSLAALTANVVQYLQKKKIEDGETKPDASHSDKRDREEHLEEVNRRLSDGERRAYVREGVERIRRFEDRARGKRG